MSGLVDRLKKETRPNSQRYNARKISPKVPGPHLQTEFGDFVFRWYRLGGWPLGSRAGFAQCPAKFLSFG